MGPGVLPVLPVRVVLDSRPVPNPVPRLLVMASRVPVAWARWLAVSAAARPVCRAPRPSWPVSLDEAPRYAVSAMAEPVSTRAVLAGTWVKVLFGDKGSLRSGASRRARRPPWAAHGHRGKVAAVAADVTQVQGVSVAWGDHHARGALDYLTPGTRKAFCPGRVRVAKP